MLYGLLLVASFPGALMLAWRRPSPGRRRSGAVTFILVVVAVGASGAVLVGCGYALQSYQQARADPGAEFTDLGIGLGIGLAIIGAVFLLTSVAALVIRAKRPALDQ